MNNPNLKSVLVNFPDADAAALPWPADADTWEARELELFIGSGGFLKPKKKKPGAAAAQSVAQAAPSNGTPKVAAAAPAAAPTAATPVPAPPVPLGGSEGKNGTRTEELAKTTQAVPNPAPSELSGDTAMEVPSGFEVPGFSVDRFCLTMPVRVHCEDTTPYGHVRLESLTAYAERLRSLALKQMMGSSLADLKEQALAILATEYVVEIVGAGIRVMDTLRVDTTPEFPAAPLFPWTTTFHTEDGEVYVQGRFGLNMCQISESGVYSGLDEARYKAFTKDMRKWSDPRKAAFSATSLRFFSAYDTSGQPFRPSERKEVKYVVRASDCDMYNVLFQARVPSMMESCHPRRNAMSMYVNIRTSVRPDDELAVHVLSDSDSALFLCMRGGECVLSAFGRYDVQRPLCQEELKCASQRIPLLMKFIKGNGKPPASSDLDLSDV